ncbi:MAG: hypothetical protein ABI041_04175 [Bdellovibrionia bacterium]
MVPIHDTDVGEERWSKSEWENYELWEKVELRLKRQKRLWVFATAATVIFFSAIPTVVDRWPKWKTRSAARYLAQEINRMKRVASIERASYRLQFAEGAKFEYFIEKVKDCKVMSGALVRSLPVNSIAMEEGYTLIPPKTGQELGIPGLIHSFCYDYLAGSVISEYPNSVAGFGIISVKDLAEKRLDRISLLLLSGPSADVSFD